MGAASSVKLSAIASLPNNISRFNSEELVMCSQSLELGGSAESILAVYVYADSLDKMAYSAAVEFVKLQMPSLCDMAASRGVHMLSLLLESEEQMLDTYNAVGIFSERCSHALVIFASDISDSGSGLPAHLPHGFVQRCVVSLMKNRPEAAEFLSNTLNVFPPSTFKSCFTDGWCMRIIYLVVQNFIPSLRLASSRRCCRSSNIQLVRRTYAVVHASHSF